MFMIEGRSLRGALVCGACLSLALTLLVAAPCRADDGHWVTDPDSLPRLHLSWRAPYGDARALTDISVSRADTARVDTLYLTFETPAVGFPLQMLSAVLLFEPRPQDSLGTFWSFARGAPNSGNLRIVFDTILSEYCQFPWFQLVNGHVGYTSASGRGRLDLSGEVPRPKAKNLFASTQFCYARIEIDHRRGAELSGHTQPMRIRWAGAHFVSARGKVMHVLGGRGLSVTWNAGKKGLTVGRPTVAPLVWIPRSAPPSKPVSSTGPAADARAVPDTTVKVR